MSKIPRDIDGYPIKQGEFYLHTGNGGIYYHIGIDEEILIFNSHLGQHYLSLELSKKMKKIQDIKEYIKKQKKELGWIEQKLSEIEILKHGLRPYLSDPNL